MKCFTLHILLSAPNEPVCTVSEVAVSATLLRVVESTDGLTLKEAVAQLAAHPYEPVLLTLVGKGMVAKAVPAGVPPSVAEALGVQVARPSEYALQAFGAGSATILAVARVALVQEMMAALGPVAGQIVSLNLSQHLLVLPFAPQVQAGPDLGALAEAGERLAAEAGVLAAEAPALAHAYAWRNAPGALAQMALFPAQAVRMQQLGGWHRAVRIAFPVAAVLLLALFLGRGALQRSVDTLAVEVDDHSILLATIASHKTLIKTRTRTLQELGSTLVASSEAPRLLDRMAESLPGSIRFTSLAYHPSPEACEQLGYKAPPPGILISGEADVSAQLADYVLSLEKIPGISSARIVRSQFDFRTKAFLFLLEAQLTPQTPG